MKYETYIASLDGGRTEWGYTFTEHGSEDAVFDLVLGEANVPALNLHELQTRAENSWKDYEWAAKAIVAAYPGKTDKDRAREEGWGLFAVDGRYQLQRDDEAGVFESDVDALLFVSAKAIEGSKRHLGALLKIGTLVQS